MGRQATYARRRVGRSTRRRTLARSLTLLQSSAWLALDGKKQHEISRTAQSHSLSPERSINPAPGLRKQANAYNFTRKSTRGNAAHLESHEREGTRRRGNGWRRYRY